MNLFARIMNKKQDQTRKISGFVRHASEKEKEELIREITRQANADQRQLVEQYEAKQKSA